MSKNFSLREFLVSDTASREGIDNTPSLEVVSHLEELADFLQGLRDAWGKPIRVTSGYRCPELNKAVGGVKNSAHLFGYGADIVSDDFSDFTKFALAWIKSKDFDQFLIEKSGSTRWLHISIRNSNGEQRHQIKSIEL